MKPLEPIWIRNYVDSLLEFAKKAGPESAMGKSAILRAEHVMDLVEAWKKYGEGVK